MEFGLALDLKNIVTIEYLPNECKDIILHDKKAVIEHCLIIMRKLFNSDAHFKVEVEFDKHLNEHCGLASNAMLSNSIFHGVNYIFGNFLSKEELIEILDNNFVEEHNGLLVRDICTGIAHNVCSLGGLCIVSDNGKLIKKFNFPSNYKIFLIKTSKVNKMSNIKTEESIVDLLKKHDTNIYEKSYKILNEIIPDLNQNNIESLFRYNHQLQHVDNTKNISDYYFINDLPVSKVLLNFENLPNVMAGLSTNAKFVYIISSNIELIKKICIKNNLNFSIFSINNNGIDTI